jgi:uroporphyrinogen-III decarboxylase
MTGRERLLSALNHQTPDKIPVDFNATGVTGMHVTNVTALREYWGLARQPVKVWEPYQMLGWLDDDLLDALGIDVQGLFSRNNMFGFPNQNWKNFRTFWGQEVLVPGEFNTTFDSNGDLLIYPQGDQTAAPSGRMPVNGFYFDAIVRQKHFDEENLNPADNQEEFELIAEVDLAHFRRELDRLADSSRGLIGNLGGTGIGDIALVPAPFLKDPRGIRDITEWYVSTVARQDYLHAIFSHQVEIALQNLEKINAVIGDRIDVVFICGTDFGTQTSSFCSLETFDRLYAPYYKKINHWVHQHTGWKTFKHSCGAVEPFMSKFIEVGFDVINPVQCSATGMDPKRLKANYGEHLVFWGGGVDTQKTLPFGNPEAVRREVLERCEIFAPHGGFVFNAIHNIQPNTPVENIVAMFMAVKEFNGEK